MKKFFLLVFLLFINYALSDDGSISIEADTISSSNNSINANGNVVVKSDDKKLFTNELEYDKETKVISTESNSKFLTKSGTLYFNNGDVTSDLKDGNFSKASLKFNNNVFILSDYIKKKDNDTYFTKNTTYYICPVNEDVGSTYNDVEKNLNSGFNCKNIFSMKSKDAKIDGKKKIVYLKNSSIRFFNFPVFYIPYFYTSRPFIDKVSGFDFPHVENLEDYGFGIYFPYVLYFENNSRLKVDPVIYQHGSFATKFIYKKNSNNGDFNINFTYLFDNKVSKFKKNIFGITEYEEEKYKDNRAYLAGIGNYKFDDYTFMDFDIGVLSDNYLYRDFLKKYNDHLKSSFNFSLIDFKSFNYTSFNITGFQELRENASLRQRTTPFAIPRIDVHLTTDNILDNNDSLFIESDTTLLTSDISSINENKYTRYYTDKRVSYSTIKFGSKIRTNMDLFIDFYNKDKEFIDTSNEGLILSKNHIRIIPEFSFDVRSPYYLFNSKNIVFEPIVQYYVSNKDYGYNKKFLNEDSRKSGINILNLFSRNRFVGLDRREYGERVNYGFNLNTKTFIGDFSFKLGQAYRDTTDYEIIGFDKKFSDILSGFGYVNNIFSFDYIMNIDRADKYVKSNSMLFNIFLGKFSFYSNYTYNYNKNSPNNHDFIKEVKTGLSYNFYRGWNLSFESTHDLERSKITEIDSSIDYGNDCFETGIKLGGDNFSDSGDGKNVNFSFYFKLKNF